MKALILEGPCIRGFGGFGVLGFRVQGLGLGEGLGFRFFRVSDQTLLISKRPGNQIQSP